jgi:hypothetical protein
LQNTAKTRAVFHEWAVCVNERPDLCATWSGKNGPHHFHDQSAFNLHYRRRFNETARELLFPPPALVNGFPGAPFETQGADVRHRWHNKPAVSKMVAMDMLRSLANPTTNIKIIH